MWKTSSLHRAARWLDLDVVKIAAADIAEVEAYAVGHGSLSNAPGINVSTLKAKGFTDDAIEKVEKALPTAFDVKFSALKKQRVRTDVRSGTSNLGSK